MRTLFGAAFALCTVFPLAAAPNWPILKLAVVRVESSLRVADTGAILKETGTGVVIATSPLDVRVLTAKHILKPDDRRLQLNSLEVYFFPNMGIPYKAEVFQRAADGFDWVVLEVTQQLAARKLPAKIPRIPWRQVDSLKQGADVWNVDYEWRITRTNLASLNNGPNPDQFSVSGGAGKDGFSGGPVFDSDGDLLGIHLGGSQGGAYAFAEKISPILKSLERVGYSPENIVERGESQIASGGSSLSTVPLGTLGSSITFDPSVWATTEVSSTRVSLAHDTLGATLILEDIQTPFDTLRSLLIDHLGGESSTKIEDKRIVSIHGQNFMALRVRRGADFYVAYFYSGPAGTLQAVIFGQDDSVDSSQSEIAQLMDGISLKSRF